MIKILVVVLLLANVAVFGWQYNTHVATITRDAMTARPPLPADTPGLTLLAEMDALPEAKNPEEEVQGEDETFSEVYDHIARADRCLDVGPFTDAAARDAFREWMVEYIAVLNVRTEKIRGRQLFWVYLEPTSADDARANIEELRSSGFTDYMLIRRGNLKNAISLGLFRSQDSVNRRLAELDKIGYSPVVVPQYETAERYWFAAQLAEDYSDALEVPESLLGAATASEVDCDTIQTADTFGLQ